MEQWCKSISLGFPLPVSISSLSMCAASLTASQSCSVSILQSRCCSWVFHKREFLAECGESLLPSAHLELSLLKGNKARGPQQGRGSPAGMHASYNRTIYCCLLLFQSKSAKEISQRQKKHLSEEIIIIIEIRKPSNIFAHTVIAWHSESQ